MAYKLLLACVIIAIGLWLFVYVHDKQMEKMVNEANEAYQAGMQAKSLVEEQTAFNLALSKYVQAKNRLESRSKVSAKLYENIGNSLVQLEQYPLAIYYYTQSLAKSPRNDELRNRLGQLRSKLGVSSPVPHKHSLWTFFHYRLSLDERLKGFVFLGVFAITFASLAIWKPKLSLKVVAGIFGACAFLLIASALYTQYVGTIKAVVIEPSSYYQGPGHRYQKVSEEPLIGGEQVSVLGMSDDGKWLKVESANHLPGFVLSTYLRLIEP